MRSYLPVAVPGVGLVGSDVLGLAYPPADAAPKQLTPLASDTANGTGSSDMGSTSGSYQPAANTSATATQTSMADGAPCDG